MLTQGSCRNTVIFFLRSCGVTVNGIPWNPNIKSDPLKNTSKPLISASFPLYISACQLPSGGPQLQSARGERDRVNHAHFYGFFYVLFCSVRKYSLILKAVPSAVKNTSFK